MGERVNTLTRFPVFGELLALDTERTRLVLTLHDVETWCRVKITSKTRRGVSIFWGGGGVNQVCCGLMA